MLVHVLLKDLSFWSLIFFGLITDVFELLLKFLNLILDILVLFTRVFVFVRLDLYLILNLIYTVDKDVSLFFETLDFSVIVLDVILQVFDPQECWHFIFLVYLWVTLISSLGIFLVIILVQLSLQTFQLRLLLLHLCVCLLKLLVHFYYFRICLLNFLVLSVLVHLLRLYFCLRLPDPFLSLLCTTH